MQLYALDQGKPTNARQAKKKIDYTCLECGGTVHVRSGPERQPHFYHLTFTDQCRQSKKSLLHIQVQNYLEKILPEGECAVEHRFPSIGRIADVAWLSKNIVFEVQCSPMSIEEASARNRDYKSLGFEVVWILHDTRYNKPKATPLEQHLKKYPLYFTNISEKGEGMIYDQLDFMIRAFRRTLIPKQQIDCSKPFWQEASFDKQNLPLTLARRMQNVPLYFEGDVIFQALFSNKFSKELSLALQKEAFFQSGKGQEGMLLKLWRLLKSYYLLVFRFFLEQACS